MESLEFEMLEAPHLARVPGFRFAHHRVKGPYQPWSRVQAIDAVAEALERVEVERAGAALGVYYDLPWSMREPEAWIADLGYPVAAGAHVPPRPALRVRDVPDLRCASLRYRGDLTTFPHALQHLVGWIEARGLDGRGPLMERFHVSDALSGEEERDVMIALDPLAA